MLCLGLPDVAICRSCAGVWFVFSVYVGSSPFLGSGEFCFSWKIDEFPDTWDGVSHSGQDENHLHLECSILVPHWIIFLGEIPSVILILEPHEIFIPQLINRQSRTSCNILIIYSPLSSFLMNLDSEISFCHHAFCMNFDTK